jgi:hypothetical protein
MARKIEGHDYVNRCRVALAAAEWQRRYRDMNRRHEDGETFYTPKARGPSDRPRIAAEAYGYIAATKEQKANE